MWSSGYFQPGESPSRGLPCYCEIFGNLRLTFVSSSSQSSSVARQENMTECNNAGLLLAVRLHTSQTHIYTTNILIENWKHSHIQLSASTDTHLNSRETFSASSPRHNPLLYLQFPRGNFLLLIWDLLFSWFHPYLIENIPFIFVSKNYFCLLLLSR